MYVDTLCRQISVCRWKDSGGGVNSELLAIAESDLRERLAILSEFGYNIQFFINKERKYYEL